MFFPKLSPGFDPLPLARDFMDKSDGMTAGQKELIQARSDAFHSRISSNERLVYNTNEPVALADAAGTLLFSSEFESGNLERAYQVQPTEYDLELASDANARGSTQWFNFSVTNAHPACYTFNLVNFVKPSSLYNKGLKPCFYSRKNKKWTSVGTNVCYFKNCLPKRDGNQQTSDLYAMSFDIELADPKDVYYLAYCYPFTYTDLQIYLRSLEEASKRQTVYKLKRSVLCTTVQGRRCDVLKISRKSPRKKAGGSEKEKKYVVVSGRVHPGETNASWVIKGMLDYLTSNKSCSVDLLDSYRFVFIPMLNPDGVAIGNYRCDTNGYDLNRCWKTPSETLHPTIYHSKNYIRRLLAKGEVTLFFDVHGHSRKQNIFAYGNANTRRYRLKNAPKYPHSEKVLPMMLSKLCSDFAFNECTFHITKKKEGTARVVNWAELGVPLSYTIEASFLSASSHNGEDNYTINQYQEFGMSLLRTVHEYTNPNQMLVQAAVAELCAMQSGKDPTDYTRCLDLFGISNTYRHDRALQAAPAPGQPAPGSPIQRLAVPDDVLREASDRSTRSLAEGGAGKASFRKGGPADNRAKRGYNPSGGKKDKAEPGARRADDASQQKPPVKPQAAAPPQGGVDGREAQSEAGPPALNQPESPRQEQGAEEPAEPEPPAQGDVSTAGVEPQAELPAGRQTAGPPRGPSPLGVPPLQTEPAALSEPAGADRPVEHRPPASCPSPLAVHLRTPALYNLPAERSTSTPTVFDSSDRTAQAAFPTKHEHHEDVVQGKQLGSAPASSGAYLSDLEVDGRVADASEDFDDELMEEQFADDEEYEEDAEEAEEEEDEDEEEDEEKTEESDLSDGNPCVDPPPSERATDRLPPAARDHPPHIRPQRLDAASPAQQTRQQGRESDPERGEGGPAPVLIEPADVADRQRHSGAGGEVERGEEVPNPQEKGGLAAPAEARLDPSFGATEAESRETAEAQTRYPAPPSPNPTVVDPTGTGKPELDETCVAGQTPAVTHTPPPPSDRAATARTHQQRGSPVAPASGDNSAPAAEVSEAACHADPPRPCPRQAGEAAADAAPPPQEEEPGEEAVDAAPLQSPQAAAADLVPVSKLFPTTAVACRDFLGERLTHSKEATIDPYESTDSDSSSTPGELRLAGKPAAVPPGLLQNVDNRASPESDACENGEKDEALSVGVKGLPPDGFPGYFEDPCDDSAGSDESAGGLPAHGRPVDLLIPSTKHEALDDDFEEDDEDLFDDDGALKSGDFSDSACEPPAAARNASAEVKKRLRKRSRKKKRKLSAAKGLVASLQSRVALGRKDAAAARPADAVEPAKPPRERAASLLRRPAV
ncbi:Cytosolic carboxypeptidase NnaD [Diplonema papillatum]|nr:Cytosolic carboxypeptidase NnaD [Diplonema papillatum]KAJ9471090.1 Cytosolic carboxypeptidase NnaD [Diplonema papillatum]